MKQSEIARNDEEGPARNNNEHTAASLRMKCNGMKQSAIARNDEEGTDRNDEEGPARNDKEDMPCNENSQC